MAKAPKQRNAPDGFVIATFNQAMAAHRAGDLARAEQLYRLVLTNDPRQFDAMHMLGVVAGQRGDFREGARVLTEALKVRPRLRGRPDQPRPHAGGARRLCRGG